MLDLLGFRGILWISSFDTRVWNPLRYTLQRVWVLGNRYRAVPERQ